MIKAPLSALVSLMICQQAFAADSQYPFNLPDNLQASININSNQQEPFNNRLLATNIFDFDSKTEQEFIDKFNPLTIRFPHGLWANWYDWHTDTTRVFGTDSFQYIYADGSTKTKTIDHLSSLKIFETNQTKVGIDGLTEINTKRKMANGQGFDMVWTFNMSADGTNFNDGSIDTVARYQDLLNRGFEVNDIEMGNENFYPGQRSSIIPNVDDYIQRAKSISKAIKAINPNVQLSIPLLRRENSANPDWNKDLTEDQDYFDAVTVHTYVGSDPDDETNSDDAYSTALTARYHLAKSINDYALKVAPNKPIWLTEWGVKSGGANAASVLGMADSYIFMSENQHIYNRANWFSVNGKLNSFVVWEEYVSPSGVVRPRIKYPLEKTAFGLTHHILRSVLENSVMLKAELNSVELDHGVKAVSARAVVKNNKIEILVLNLADKPSEFTINIDNTPYTGVVNHSTMAFEQIDEERNLPVDNDPLLPITTNNGVISLPKLSINKIVLEDSQLTPDRFNLLLDSQSHSYAFDKGQTITVIANADTNTSTISSVTFSDENGQIIKTVTQAPYQIDWQPQIAGINTITATALRADGVTKVSKALKVNITGEPLQFDVNLSTPAKTTLNIDESLELIANATTNDGQINHVEFKINGTTKYTATTAPYTFDWQATAAGTYQIEVVASHSNGSTKTSDTLQVVVEQPAPPLQFSVNLSTPTKTTLNTAESSMLSANASTNNGEITRVEFRVNGVTKYTATSSPFTFNWQATTAGTYQIEAVAKHSNGTTKVSERLQMTVVKAEVPPTTEPKTAKSSGGSTGLYWISLIILTLFRRPLSHTK